MLKKILANNVKKTLQLTRTLMSKWHI